MKNLFHFDRKITYRTIAVFLLTVIFVLAAATTASANNGYIRGDADNNGEVDILDATCIQRYLASYTVKNFNVDAASITGETVSIIDATAIQRYLASYANIYNIGEFVGGHPQAERPTEDDEIPFMPAV